MGQPTPPGDNIPLIEGLDASWNDIVNYIPEDKRSEFAPAFKERIGSIESKYEPLKQWEDLQKSGITPDHVGTALNTFTYLEDNPREALNAIAEHLGLTVAEAGALKDVIEDDNPDNDPRLAKLQQQVETMAQILLTQRDGEVQSKQQEAAEKAISDEIAAVTKKYGDVDEQQIVMRMLHLDMTAEQAYQDYTNRDSEIRKRRPAPMIMGANGGIPNRKVDPTKLSGPETKNIVAQMFRDSNEAGRS